LLRSQGFCGLPVEDVKIFGRQILEGFQFLHSRGIVHCDLKPENVCLINNGRPDLRIIDFGTSCRLGGKHYEYRYVQSRFYRAPEIFLGIEYGTAVDMWSFGCLMSELTTGRPIFSGDNEQQQMKLFVQALGPPKSSLLARGKRKSRFFSPDGVLLGGTFPARSVREVTGIVDDELIELLQKCLDWDQQTRITAVQALKLPYFAGKPKRQRAPASGRVPAVSPAQALSARRLVHTRPVVV
jgi:dual specificity tyrosine-phosphorylation-regulated kinase 2/3/4